MQAFELQIIYSLGQAYATRYNGELFVATYEALLTFWANGPEEYDALCAGGF